MPSFPYRVVSQHKTVQPIEIVALSNRATVTSLSSSVHQPIDSDLPIILICHVYGPDTDTNISLGLLKEE